MDAILASLIAESEREVARLQDELALERRLLGRLRARASNDVSKGGSPTHASRRRKSSNRRRGLVVPGSLVSHIIEVLKAASKPLRAPDIAAKLAERGYTTDAKSGLTVAVSSTLAHGRDKVFERTGPGTYTLKPDEGGTG